MAIGNVTPDSFYPASRLMGSTNTSVDGLSVVRWARKAIEEGAHILDIGACSTRPGSTPVSQEEEWTRLQPALEALRDQLPDTPLSLDTFRPEIARKAIEQFGALIINDISGGCDAMSALARETRVPYVLTLRGDMDLPSRRPDLQDLDLILDPGFGFIGNLEKDYQCLRSMDKLKTYHRPILVGVSRKSMIYKPLGLTPDTCLSATQVIQFYALQQGATILRTHDVQETAHTIALFERIKKE